MIHLLHPFEEFISSSAVGFMLIGTLLYLSLIALLLCIRLDICFFTQTQGTDDGKWHLFHL